METDDSNQPPYPVHEDSTTQLADIDRYQYVMLDSVALETMIELGLTLERD